MKINICRTFLVSLVIVLTVFPIPAITANIPAAKSDKGLVIFYRLSAFKGKAIRFNVNHAEATLGQLLSGTYLHKYFEPGTHNFTVQGVSLDGQDSISINVKAGKKYYIKGEMLIG